MKRYNKILIAIFTLLFIVSLPVTNIKAEEREKNIIVLIDNSGSMNANDSTRLSLVAASMLIDTVDLNSTKLNVIAFGDKLIYAKRLAESPTAEELKGQIASVKFDNQYTNLKEGIGEALSQFKDVEGDKSIIVLSDGKEEVPGESKEEHEKKLNDLIESAQQMNVEINTIGLSKDSDKNALSDIANKTLGDYFYVENAAGIFDVFSKILGNINGYYTVDRFTTKDNIDKEIKVSAFVEEVIVNVFSVDQDFPSVNVSNDKNINFGYKSGDRYKIFKLKNDGSGNSNSIKVSSSGENVSSIIVQIKSKVEINVNTSSDSFEIPYKVPMNIEAVVKTDKEISDLQLYEIDEGEKKLLTKENNSFKFEFKKDKPGYYPVFLIACDGNGNILSGKYFNITVTNNIPFSYKSQLLSHIYTGNDVEIRLEQQDSIKVRDGGGDIYVWYEGSNQPQVFPLKFEGGSLYTKINLENTGKVKLSAQIRGIREERDEPFFYYLPAINSEVIEKLYVEFKSEIYKNPFKEKEPITLELVITDNKLNKEEVMLLYDSNNNKLKEFIVKPGEDRVAIELGNIKKSEPFNFLIKAKNPDSVKVYGEINTNIKVISAAGYFWYKYKAVIVAFVVLVFLMAGFILLCLTVYRNEVENYSINKDIEVSVPSIGLRGGESVSLSTDNDTVYLDVSNNGIKLSYKEETGYSIGCFKLKVPEGNKVFLGLRYLLMKEEIFEVSYIAISEQNTLEGSPITEMPYRPNDEIIARSRLGNKTIKIFFY